MKKIIVMMLFLTSQTYFYAQCSPNCQLNNIGLYMWLGDSDSQNIGDSTNDEEDDDDFIAFKNYGSAAVNISGWQLYTDQKGTLNPVFTFPSGTVLQPGQYAMIVSDWNPGPALPSLWFGANFAPGEGMFEETSNNSAWAILRNPNNNQYITIHQQGNFSSGESLSPELGTKKCNLNVTNLIPNDFEGCQAVYYNQNTCSLQLITDCSLPLINSDCAKISNLTPSLSSSAVSFSCPTQSYNLNNLHTGSAPSGTTLVWYTNNTHTGTAISNPTAVTAGTYYAFYYSSSGNCYSAPSSFVTVTTTALSAPSLSATTIRNSCPSLTVNLNSLHTASVPSGTTLVWYMNNSHTGTAISNPTAVTAGTYYAFYYSSNGNCYSTASSSVKVTIIDDCYCTQPPATGTPDNFTLIGITTQTKQPNWPDRIPNSFISLESRTKGFIITRVASQNVISDPKEGMLIYDTSDNCIKLYNGVIWKCIQRRCNN